MSSAAVVLMDHWREAKIKQEVRHASLVQEAEDYLKDSNKDQQIDLLMNGCFKMQVMIHYII